MWEWGSSREQEELRGQEVNDTERTHCDFFSLQFDSAVSWLSIGIYVCCNHSRATKTSRSLNVYSHPLFYCRALFYSRRWLKRREKRMTGWKSLSPVRKYIHPHTANDIKERLNFTLCLLWSRIRLHYSWIRMMGKDSERLFSNRACQGTFLLGRKMWSEEEGVKCE